MDAYASLLDRIQSLKIIDTHEHLPLESERPLDADVLSEWLFHYFSSDLVSAGMSDKDMALARESSGELKARWKIAEPYWHAASSTGYGRALALSAKDLYGVDSIDASTIEELDRRFKEARAKGGHYKFVLKEKSGIALSIRDQMPLPYKETSDPFVFTMKVDSFVCPASYAQMLAVCAEEGVELSGLSSWMEATRRRIERSLDGTRVVCLKSALAYQRSLRFDKVARSDAERAFNEFSEGRSLPAWRPPSKAAAALSDWMMHFVCQVADERSLPFQTHTGILEGNGCSIGDTNPALLANLFLEYRNVKFDVFHMGYPYVMELGALAKNFRNVYIDMCWGHIISPEAARRALAEWLDAVPANKISAFGGDYCFVDGVYGHQHIARRNVAQSLAWKVSDGSMSLARAEEVAGWLFVENPKRLFGLERFLS